MKRFTVYVGVLLSVLMAWGLIYAVGIRVNTTPSIPLGLYQLYSDWSILRKIQRGYNTQI